MTSSAEQAVIQAARSYLADGHRSVEYRDRLADAVAALDQANDISKIRALKGTAVRIVDVPRGIVLNAIVTDVQVWDKAGITMILNVQP